MLATQLIGAKRPIIRKEMRWLDPVSEGQGEARSEAPQHPGVGLLTLIVSPALSALRGQPSAGELGAAGPDCGSALGAEEHRSLRGGDPGCVALFGQSSGAMCV